MQPWCHYPGCTLLINTANPLTAQHVVPVSLGGVAGPLVAYCQHHNMGLGNRSVK